MSTLSATDLPFDAAIAYLRQKANVTSQSYLDVWGRANVKSFTVAGAATQALVQDFRREVTKALERGTSLQEFRKSFDQIVAKHGWAHTGKPGWRARVIYETNLSMAYSAGRWSQQTEPETLAAFPYLQYVHSGALHPRLQHVAWNGLTLRADDPFWKTHYPPNGWHCGCRARSVSARGLQRMGKSGPDRAPAIEMREVVIRRTGEVKWVAEGIDPGFDYNPGMEWTGKAPQIPANATLRPPPVSPQPPDPAPLAPKPPLPELTPPKLAPPEPSPVKVASSADLTAADDLLHHDFAAWGRRLSEAESDALEGYKGPGFGQMNRHLRGIADEPHHMTDIRALDGALSRAKTKRAVTVHRGVSPGTPWDNAKVGDVLHDAGFTSTSINPGTAENFSGSLRIEIRLPKGYTGGAYVNRIPGVDHLEFEFLIRPGAPFRVIERTGNRIVVEPVRGGRRRSPKLD